jgi:hypothetical protein
MVVGWLAAMQVAFLMPISPLTRGLAQQRTRTCLAMSSGDSKVVPLEALNPSPTLEPREVISSVMAALHRSNWDSPTDFYGFEVALRFLAPTHAAKLKGAKPSGFSRYLRQPHKIKQIEWNEYRFEGELVMLKDDDEREEAYQMCSLRSSPTDEWQSARFKLVRVDSDFGEVSSLSQWMIEAIYSSEPDTPEDIEYLRSKMPSTNAERYRQYEGPGDVVRKVMLALRDMDKPYPLHGAVVATRYCSPRNRASELSPEMFASYLEDPWYSILSDWDEIQDEDDDDQDNEEQLWTCAQPACLAWDPHGVPVVACACAAMRAHTAHLCVGTCIHSGQADVDVLVKCEDDPTFTMISWKLSLHDEQWLIDSLNIIS